MKKILLAISISVGFAQAALATPKLLPFQGHLTQSNGQAIADGGKVVQFKIYDAPVSGTAVWAGEVHKLSVNKGLVNTILGTKTAFPARYGAGNAKVMFSEPLYVEITVDADGNGSITAADPPLLPRQVLLPANFAHVAMSAETVEGVDLVDENTNTLNPSVIKNGSIPATAIVADNSIQDTQLAPDAVGYSEMKDSSVGSSEIINGSIAFEDLAADLLRKINPPGTIMPFAGPAANVPDGWLLCDGRAMDKDADSGKYQALHDAILQSWGNGSTGDGAAAGVTEFNLPDMRGVFLRGVNGALIGTGNDPQKDSRVARRTGGNIGNLVGSYQSYEIQSHTHGVFVEYFENTGTGWRLTHGGNANGAHVRQSKATGGDETRPKNVYVNYIIKY